MGAFVEVFDYFFVRKGLVNGGVHNVAIGSTINLGSIGVWDLVNPRMTTFAAELAVIGGCEEFIINMKNMLIGVIRIALCYVVSANSRKLMTHFAISFDFCQPRNGNMQQEEHADRTQKNC